MTTYRLILTSFLALAWSAAAELQSVSSLNSTSSSSSSSSSSSFLQDGFTKNNNASEASTAGSRVSSVMTHLPTLKNAVMLVCAVTAVLITCLLVKIFRSGRRIRKTRKYDIITTPAERVEMAPLNDDNDEEDDSTLFDVKYR